MSYHAHILAKNRPKYKYSLWRSINQIIQIIGLIRIIKLLELIGLIKLIGLIELIGLIKVVGLIELIRFIELIVFIELIGFIKLILFIEWINLINRIYRYNRINQLLSDFPLYNRYHRMTQRNLIESFSGRWSLSVATECLWELIYLMWSSSSLALGDLHIAVSTPTSKLWQVRHSVSQVLIKVKCS